MKEVSYDKENDILFMHKGFSNDDGFKGNLNIGDLVLDISKKGKVRGVEIFNASTFFKEFKIGPSVIENIEDAKFDAAIKATGVTIGFLFKTKQKELPAKIAVSF